MPQHATTTSFQPGHRGAPGRPPRDVAVPTAHAVRRLARSFSEEALKTLLELMRNPKVHGNVRIKAAQAVLDRGLGLPTQPIDVVVSRVLAKRLRKESEEIKMPRGGARPGAGRPRGAWSKRTVEDMRRVGPMGERALAVLTAAMENPKVPWSARITAAGMIADRAFGRAPQSVSLDVTRRLNELSISALRALEAKLAGEERLIDLWPAETSSADDS